MLLRGSNAVGYANYPDNVVKFFVRQAADAGVDLFRVFDCLNWVENMRVSMDAVREAGKLCEGAMCYTGDILDPDRAKYSLKYYVGLAKELEAAGANIIGIKDMAGLLKPAAARKLVKTLREESGLPFHFHTHDTSGIAAASILAAVEGRRRCVRCGDGFDVRADVAGVPRRAGRGDRRYRPRHRARSGGDPAHLVLFRGGQGEVRRLRGGLPRGRLGGLPARDAGWAVHQPQGAGAVARSRGAVGTRSRAPMPTST